MTNHFAIAEDLLRRANECVVDSITRNLVARATVHATLAQVQVLEDAFGLRSATSPPEPDVLAAYGRPPQVETPTLTKEIL